MPPIRVIFCGTPSFACPSLQALRDDPAFEVVAVITQPDKPAGRGKRLMAPPVKERAKELGIPVLQPEDINRFQVSPLRQGGVYPRLRRGEGQAGFQPSPRLRPAGRFQESDFLVTIAYGQIFGRELLAMPKIAPVNVHYSLLPRWRGAAPLQHALLHGDRETGVTIQRMVERLDSGPLLAQGSIPIESRDTRVTLEAKLSSLGTRLLIETLKQPLQERPQNESSASYCQKLTREMGNVDPSKMTAEEIDRHVRALVPWPGVQMDISCHAERRPSRTSSTFASAHSAQYDTTGPKTKHVKLIETSLEPHKDALAISCKGGTTLYALKLQPPAKRVMTGAEWRRGRSLDVESP